MLIESLPDEFWNGIDMKEVEKVEKISIRNCEYFKINLFNGNYILKRFISEHKMWSVLFFSTTNDVQIIASIKDISEKLLFS